MSALLELRDRLIRAGLEALTRARLPQTSGRFALQGLREPVEVLRDRWGVPHIYAQNELDLIFAQGFVHAQDRLWQMEFYRRLGAGRLAEVLGPEALEVDRWMRVLGLRRVAEQEAAQMDDTSRWLLDAYCAGVNAQLSQLVPSRGPDRLPIEFALLRFRPEPWTPGDSLAWGKIMAWILSGNWEAELLRSQLVERLGEARAAELELQTGEVWPLVLHPGEPPTQAQAWADAARAFVGPGAEDGVGSNNWVITGRRSASGAPVLANDMHLGLTLPAMWYENHLSGGGLQVSGVSFPGVPLVIVGHNGRVAWGFTAAYPDVEDLYVEHIRANESGVEYEFRGEWLPAEVRREEIQVRGAAPVVEEVIVTRHGPLVNGMVEGSPDTPLALRFIALEPEQIFAAVYRMNLAQDCYAFRRALRGWPTPNQNAVFADVKGNIAYQLIGKVPIRARGNGSVPVPGWDGEYEWTGVVPFEDLPYLINPPEGFIATANNRIVDDEFPYDLGRDYLFGDRAERIVELIQAREQLDIDYVQQMQFDLLSPTARDLTRCVCRLDPVEPALAAAVELLRAWDGRLERESAAAALYETLLRSLLQIVLADKLGDLAGRYMWSFHSMQWLRKILAQPDSPWFDLGGGETRDEVLRLALRQAVNTLQEKFGSDPAKWAWGEINRLTFGHIFGRRPPLDRFFNRGPYPIGGDGTTVWAALAVERGLGKDLFVGPPFRFIADLADLDHSLGQLVPGQSGHPVSPHYADQVPDWFERRYHPMLFRRPEVEQACEAKLELHPKKGKL